MAKTEVRRHQQRSRPLRGLGWLILLVLFVSAAVNLVDPDAGDAGRGIGLFGMVIACGLSYWLGRSK